MTAITARLWTEAEDRQLVDMRATGLTWTQVGERMGRSASAVGGRYARITAPGWSARGQTHWTPEDDRIAVEMNRIGASKAEIGARVGRTVLAVASRLSLIGATRRTPWNDRLQALPDSEIALIDGEADSERAEACWLHLLDLRREHGAQSRSAGRGGANPRPSHDGSARMAGGRQAGFFGAGNVTAFLCGDPAPGRSALDQRRAGEAGR